MSVLIKGMDMPKRCVDCPMYLAGMCSAKMMNGRCPLDGRPDWCPIEEMPETEPVRHGKWEVCKASIHPYGNDVRCSVCKHQMGSSFGYKYCPMCGARMDEEER